MGLPRVVMATMDGRGGIPASKSGQRVEGVSNVDPGSWPGCCTATNSVVSSGVKQGPHNSAPRGAFRPSRLLTNATRVFAEKCVDGITVNQERCAQLASRSLALVTALNPHIGYLNAAKVAKESLRTRKAALQLVIEHKLMDPKTAARLLDPARLSQGV